MATKKTTFWSLGATLAVALVGLTVSFALTPAPSAEACGLECEPCPAGSPNSTATVWGKAANCQDAEQDAFTQAFQLAAQGCGCAREVCNFQLVIHPAGCWWNGQEYVVDAHGIYNCRSCDDPGPWIP